jgi:N-acyl homoserine lactone hydrolase
VNVFLIAHPAGLCLFDTGQSAAAAAKGYFPAWHPFLRLARFELEPREEVGAQLLERGIDPGTVRWVVLSHLHTDHVGGVAWFPDAEVLVARVEWERAAGLAGRLRGYLPEKWPAAVRPVLVDFDDGPLGPFAASRRLTADGSLLLLHTPGHTPGHLALLAAVGERRVLCGGDIATSAEELADSAPAIARFCSERGIAFLASHDPCPILE